MTRAKLSRRGLLGLGALSLGAVGLGAWLRRGIPIGEDISDRIDVAAIASQPGFPGEGPAEAMRAAGDVRVIHRDWPILGPQSLRAARLALAAERRRQYLPVHNALMRSPGLSEPAIRTAVIEAGADWELLEADLIAYATEIDRQLARTAQDALRLGYAGTPGFLIGPIRINGGASERQFADAIERARAALDIAPRA